MKNCKCLHLACQNCNQIEKFTQTIYKDEAWIRDCPELNQYKCKYCNF